MHHTKTSLLITLHRILVKGEKHYATPSIDSIIKLLAERHRTYIKRRWTFQCFRDLIDLRYVARHERHLRQEDGSILQIPSLLTITLKGARILYNLGVAGAEKLMADIRSWYKKGLQRWPSDKKTAPAVEQRTSAGGLQKIGDLLASIVPSAEPAAGLEP